MKLNLNFRTSILLLLLGSLAGCSSAEKKLERPFQQDKDGNTVLDISGSYGPHYAEPTGREGMEGRPMSESQVEFNKAVAKVVQHTMREWMSSSPTGVLGRFETSSTKNIEAINTQVLEDFKTLQTNGAEVEVYSSNNSLPPGIISKADGFVIQRGYRHQWLGCFKLVTEPKAVGDADHLAQEAKLMTAAAGGDFVFLPALLYDSSVRWQTMGGCAFKLDPRMKRKLQQATAADQAAYEKYLSSLPSPTPQVSSSVMEIEESIEVE